MARHKKPNQSLNQKIYPILLLLSAGFFVRLIALRLDYAFETDVHTFQSWAMQLVNYGFSEFYGLGTFSDYPPVYMYVLYVLGLLRLAADWEPLSFVFNFFTFLPAILSDLGIGFVLYRLGVKSYPDSDAPLFIAGAWVFNPAIILISGVWGQIESVFVLILLISLVLMREKKFLPAYILYGIAILTKPQSLFFGPVFLYYAYDFLRDGKFGRQSVQKLAIAIAAGVAAMAVVSLPFGLTATAHQLLSGIDMYNFASVNAFNIWALAGQNWVDLYTTMLGLSYAVWGVVIVLIIIVASMCALHFDKRRFGGKYFYLLVAGLITTIFVFSVKMHERYLFPALLFLLVYYLERRERRAWYLYLGFSATFFANALAVLRWPRADWDLAVINAWLPFVSFWNVVFGVLLILFIAVLLLKGKELLNNGFWATKIYVAETQHVDLPQVNKPPKMGARDWFLVSALVMSYSVLAFVNLGDIRTPQTTWLPELHEYALVDFGGDVELTKLQFLMGARHDRPFDVEISLDGVDWENLHSVTEASVFAWTDVPLNTTARFARILPQSDELRIQEIAFRDGNGELIAVSGLSVGAENLFDEQYLVPAYSSFMNSTYFDEVFHPRAGYEFVHALPVFENTHPPLGKVFIAASVRLLGMTPFAWRLPGTVFGILMIPLVFAFARQLLRSNSFAHFVAFIFTFDFMLFSQTRLATIDTYVTFFVIGMYFFMYLYVRDVESASLRKSLALLALCGAFMGLAIAAKWQGIYAALGLPILFFPALYKLYKIDARRAMITFISCFGLFIALPLFLYGLSYIPFVRASGGGGVATIWQNQLDMFDYHAFLVAEHPFASPWWSWPLVLRPLWQYASPIVDGSRQSMSSIGSPAVWWFGIFASLYALYYLVMKRFKERDLAFLLVAYAAQFLPWAFVTRLTFIYHYFPSVPFIALMIGWFFKERLRHNGFAFAYAGLVLALFAFFYPVLAGAPVDVEFARRYLMWLPRWFFA